jgi:hypothetical protein
MRDDSHKLPRTAYLILLGTAGEEASNKQANTNKQACRMHGIHKMPKMSLTLHLPLLSEKSFATSLLLGVNHAAGKGSN